MRFELTAEQRDFASALDALLTASDVVSTARAWALDGTDPGLKLWRRLADQGVFALLVPEEAGGLGAGDMELVVAAEVLGRHGVPGPWVESAAFLPVALTSGQAMAALAEGAVGTVASRPHTAQALDADVADHVYVAADGGLFAGKLGRRRSSIDGTRRLFEVTPDVAPFETVGAERLARAFDTAVLAVSGQLLGAGERLLADTVAFAGQRRQFGREIGSYQAVKHRLADVRIALDFARALLHGAALAAEDPASTRTKSRDVSAAKVATGDAAYLASRAALQVHGAIGYTRELDLSLWILKVRALQTAWGTPAFHRRRVLDALVGEA
ncbi:Butyryl-CoA dehydrogenase [Alloactinosynnema sp. L-07]|uniref:acyl-CoA dehydrogenase family protein n=1 Tax=Alloactinosynnema sp. L-07 TaxID=1653480 RepID=UPI00065EFF5B|nr:acyl-CoA dehydrogenase family protein [Alloactinosynnema sp. L-07]CRK57777.1 Butyryl-CoA dehydrogenase [Alloactinosynnema sp. L-07]